MYARRVKQNVESEAEDDEGDAEMMIRAVGRRRSMRRGGSL